MTTPTNPTQDELDNLVEQLFFSAHSYVDLDTGEAMVVSIDEWNAKAKRLIEAHTQQAVRSAEPRWWICTDFLRNSGEKIIGPFSTKELALDVRRLYEMLSDKTYAVDELQEDKQP